MADDDKWTEEKVMDVITNPIYTGVPPFPRLVSDDDWIESNLRLMDEYGKKKVLRSMLKILRESMDQVINGPSAREDGHDKGEER